MLGYDPIRGDIPHHQMYMLDVGVEEDVEEVPNRPGGRNGAKRHSAHRPRSMMSRREGAAVGPGSRRGSRMMTDESDEIPVGVCSFPPVDGGDLAVRLTGREDSPREVAAHHRRCNSGKRQISAKMSVFVTFDGSCVLAGADDDVFLYSETAGVNY